MKKYRGLFSLFIMVGGVLLLSGTGCNSVNTNSVDNNEKKEVENNVAEQSVADIIKGLLVAKYSLNVNEVTVNIRQQDASHAVGSTRIGSGAGGFWAAKSGGTWVLVEDGQGAISCVLLRQYSFPEIMMEHCYEPQAEDVSAILKNLFAAKYNRVAANIVINITAEDSTHAMGSVKMAVGEPGGMFWAAKTNGTWTIVADGNGSVSCSLLNQYAFPANMTTYCAN